MSNSCIRFYDSTLRDGEQTPGVAFSRPQRIAIAQALDGMGVDEVEIGFAASGEHMRADMKAVIDAGVLARTLSLSRPIKGDIDAAKETGVDGVILFIGISDIHLKHKFGFPLEHAEKMLFSGIEYAKKNDLFLQVSFEDATRTPVDRLATFATRAEKAGANRVSFADTVGIASPALMKEIIGETSSRISIPIAVHCHDDLGMAVANSLAAIEAGASYLSTTMNGIGERSGNAATEVCALAIHLLLGKKTNINLSKVTSVSQLVRKSAELSEASVKPVTGANSFRHESGIHVAALLKNPETYEGYDPSLVGGKRDVVLGKTTGRAAIKHLAGVNTDDLDQNTLNSILERVRIFAESEQCGNPDLLKELVAECQKKA